ncbi:MAG: methyl-accepting chemotaxis protein [Planctomycetes bacterium]|nr:methyl-accepting chemotaxis protein [Planctomycetota bacterium]MBL7145328.1 methyl-accepting chemotaxis protein [Phycisphaerae bacterium]
MKNLSLKVKLFLVLGILTAVAITVAFVGLNKLSGMNDRLNGIVNQSAEKVKLGARINQDILTINRAEKNIILADTQEDMDKYAAFIVKTQEEMQNRRQELRDLADSEGKAKLDEFAAKWDKYLEVNKQIREFARLNSNVRAKGLSGKEGRQAYDQTEAVMKAIATMNDEEVTTQTTLAADAASRVLLGARIVQDLLRVHRAEKNVILEEEKDKMQEYDKARKEAIASADDAAEKLRKSVTTEGRSYFDNFIKACNDFKTRSDKVVTLALAGNNAEAKTLSTGEGRAAYDNAEKALVNLVNFNDELNTQAAKAADDAASRALLCAKVVQDMLAIHRAEKNLILETTQEGMDRYAKATDQLKKDIESKISEFEKTASTQGMAKIAEFKTLWAKFLDINEQVRAISLENGNTKAFELSSGQGRQISDECAVLMTSLVDKNEKDMENDALLSDKNYATARWLTLIVSIVGIGSGLTIGFFIIIGVNRALSRIIRDLSEGSEQVSSASGQVSSASQSLAEGATEQAAGLEETSSSLEEMSSMTKQNADNAQQANTLAGEARKAGDTGNESMGRMSTAINDIQKSSDETAKIIKVIDEIAFQTNLLALNAAVEAARAGEAGKGFAVVAEEVRNLAMRSAEAAKNTSAMIEESVKNSKNGVDIASEVVKILNEIVGSIGKTTDLVSEIAAASQEQAQGIDQINTAMAQMDKVTQQNAANAEESASASEELSAQAESMNDVVGELVALVGGAANKQSRSSGRSRQVSHGAAHNTHQASNKTKQHGFGKSDHAFHKIANGHTQKQAPRQTARTSAPERVIPLQGDENTGTDDFKEFNG